MENNFKEFILEPELIISFWTAVTEPSSIKASPNNQILHQSHGLEVNSQVLVISFVWFLELERVLVELVEVYVEHGWIVFLNLDGPFALFFPEATHRSLKAFRSCGKK